MSKPSFEIIEYTVNDPYEEHPIRRLNDLTLASSRNIVNWWPCVGVFEVTRQGRNWITTSYDQSIMPTFSTGMEELVWNDLDETIGKTYKG